jgi:phosphate transport system permease protein
VGATTGYFSSPGGRGLIETLQGAYTSLPTQIYAWSRLPSTKWGGHTSAAIVVLLVAILVVNATAIWLRNRYERKW